jgi:hypothetical protein
VPPGPTTRQALEHYQDHYRVPRIGREHAFFLNNISGEPISYSAMRSSFVRLAKRSDISRLHPLHGRDEDAEQRRRPAHCSAPAAPLGLAGASTLPAEPGRDGPARQLTKR